MADEKIDIGDTVRLKSGGPLMTVAEWSKGEPDKQVCRCAWFDGSNEMLHEVCLNIATLKKVRLKKRKAQPLEPPTTTGAFAQLMRHIEEKDRHAVQLVELTVEHALSDNKRLSAAVDELRKKKA